VSQNVNQGYSTATKKVASFHFIVPGYVLSTEKIGSQQRNFLMEAKDVL